MKLFLTLIVLLCLVSAGMAADVGLAWDHSTSPDVTGYKVYFGTASGVYGTPVSIAYQNTFVVTGLNEKVEYFFAVTAFDAAGNESGYSNEVSVLTKDVTPPNPPGELRIPAEIVINQNGNVTLRVVGVINNR